MQAVLLQFLPTESFDMSKNNDQLENLRNSVQSLGDRLHDVEEKVIALPLPKPSPWWSSIVGPLVGALIAGVGIGATLWVRFDTKFDGLNSSISAINQRLDKVEAAVRVLNSQQSDQTQKLVHDLLASAAKNAPTPDAPRLVLAAKSLVQTMRNEKRTASPEFFQEGIDALNQINKSHGFLPVVFGTRVALAEFRSINEVPRWQGTSLGGDKKIEHLINIPKSDHHPFRNIDFILANVTGNAINIGEDRRLARDIVFDHVRFDGGMQILDGIHWHDVDFVGTHIRYEGGEVDLQNVRFINCTFEVPAKVIPSNRANQFIDYAALAGSELVFAGE